MVKTVKLFATLRDLSGLKELQVEHHEGQTVRDLLDQVASVHPELASAILDPHGELTGLVHILVHGRNIQWLDGLDTVIKSSDTLVFLPPSAGG